MRPGGGKAKGAEFEREVCRRLSIWVSKGRYEDVFWRASMSGGRATIAQQQGRRLGAQENDLSAIRKEGIALLATFTVECKHVKALHLQGLLYGTPSKGDCILAFWNKLLKSRKVPILIAKQNRADTLFCTTVRGAALLGIAGSEHAIFTNLDMHVFRFDDFIRNAEPFLRMPQLRLKNRSNK